MQDAKMRQRAAITEEIEGRMGIKSPLLNEVCDEMLKECQMKLAKHNIPRSLINAEELARRLKIRSGVYERMAGLCSLKNDTEQAKEYSLLAEATRSATMQSDLVHSYRHGKGPQRSTHSRKSQKRFWER